MNNLNDNIIKYNKKHFCIDKPTLSHSPNVNINEINKLSLILDEKDEEINKINS
jgi:hypothetical protein